MRYLAKRRALVLGKAPALLECRKHDQEQGQHEAARREDGPRPGTARQAFRSHELGAERVGRQADDADTVALIDVFGEVAAQGDEPDHKPVGGLEADDRLVVVFDLPCIAAARPAAITVPCASTPCDISFESAPR
jgi:hypothetical protein